MKQQREGIVVEMPKPGSKEEKVWGSDDYNADWYIVSCHISQKPFLYNTILFLMHF